MTKDENPVKICWHCKRKFDGNFSIKNLQIVCPFCKKPQSSVFEEDSQAQIIKKSKAGIKKSKSDFKKSESQKNTNKL